MKQTILGVIPARWDSTRFPGKPLAEILGRPMIQWVYESANKVLDPLVVATDDRRILKAVHRFRGEAVMTSRRCRTGTDRLAEVARRIPAWGYVNVQGDEPLLSQRLLRAVVRTLIDGDWDIVTAASFVRGKKIKDNSHVVKVVMDRHHRALYFSRSAIPHGADQYLRHIGVYAFRRPALMKFARSPQSLLERIEGLEQLRALEMGMKIGVVPVKYEMDGGVDTPLDVRRVENLLRKGKK